MSDGTSLASDNLRLTEPHPARMYDFYLGGKTNFPADRAAAAEAMQAFPHLPKAARANRAQLRRVTRYLAEQGIAQFLDIGTGIPTEPNLHQEAQAVNPACRVVYVDNDPLVLVHARALLNSTPEGRTAYVEADATGPVAAILEHPGLLETIDLSRPVALSLNALLHFVPDEKGARRLVADLVGALAPGSYLAITHATGDFAPAAAQAAGQVYHANKMPFRTRSREELAEFFQGLEMIEPGIVPPHRWRPAPGEAPATEAMDTEVSMWSGLARKP